MKCSICNAEGVNKSSCPRNPNAKNINNKHNIENTNIEDLTYELNKMKIEHTKLVNNNAKLWQIYYKEADEADLYYNKWLDAKDKNTRKNPPLKLPNNILSKIDFSLIENKCPICLDFISKDTFTMTICGHIFHDECLNKSLETGTLQQCPLCRH